MKNEELTSSEESVKSSTGEQEDKSQLQDLSDQKPQALDSQAQLSEPLLSNLADTHSAGQDPRLKRMIRKHQKRMCSPMICLPGYVWNPLHSLPPNRACPCLSGKKFKKCCRLILPKAVKTEDAELYKQQMKMPDLVFKTPENVEKLTKLATDAMHEVEEDTEYGEYKESK